MNHDIIPEVDALRWCAALVQSLIENNKIDQMDRVTLDGRTHTVADIMDAADDALNPVGGNAPGLLDALELCIEELECVHDDDFDGTHRCGRCDSSIDRNREIRNKARAAIANAKKAHGD